MKNDDHDQDEDGPAALGGYSQVALLIEPARWKKLKLKRGGASPFVRRLVRAYEENPDVRRIVDAMND